jgi:hypothetical protein
MDATKGESASSKKRDAKAKTKLANTLLRTNQRYERTDEASEEE